MTIAHPPLEQHTHCRLHTGDAAPRAAKVFGALQLWIARGVVGSNDIQASVGDGFSWGRFGPRTEIRRAGHAHVWALIPPERKPGLWQRLFKGGQ